jgi:hypothetical protein
MPSADADVELAEIFAEVARTLLDENDVDATLDRMCELAVKTIDACQAAGISIVEDKRVTSRSTTDDLPCAVDRIQSETQEGPCVDAIKEHEVFVTGSLSQESRWPGFAHHAHRETGVESILSLRLFAREDAMGALNLYSGERNAFITTTSPWGRSSPPTPPSPGPRRRGKPSSTPRPTAGTSSAWPRASSSLNRRFPTTRRSTSSGGRRNG